MGDKFDFEKYWLQKFTQCLMKKTSNNVTARIMIDSEHLSDQTDKKEIIQWTQSAMARMQNELSVSEQREVMLQCACQYPTESLQDLKHIFAENKDIQQIIGLLQKRFELFLKNDLCLEEDEIQFVLEQGWGLAGVRKGDYIIATKIPKSGLLKAYLKEKDPEKKKNYYCHCPRIRDFSKNEQDLPEIYCYCGAGFYKGIWEEILQTTIHIELTKSIIKGDDVCQVAIEIPEEFR